MRPTVVTLPLGARRYNVVIGASHLNTLPAWLRRSGLVGDPVIVTNPVVWRRGGPAMLRALRRGGFQPRLLLVPDGERAKSMPQLTRLLQRLASLDGAGRQLFVVAFGGGVVGDLAGLAAALYRRGVPYVQIPTTLLAQVDASVGGKTAVDLPHGKNLVGAFHQPRLVFIDLEWLATLPDRQWRTGLAEVIKCGVIQDRTLWRYLETHRRDLLARRPAALQTIVTRAVRVKAGVVARDEREVTGLRAVLNFGHTIGHAIEAATHYGTAYTHGEAIAVGMSAATALAVRLGLCAPSVERELNDLLRAYGLPTTARGIRPAAVLAALAHDKKARAGRVRWVLPTRIDHVIVTPDVPAALVRAVVAERVHR